MSMTSVDFVKILVSDSYANFLSSRIFTGGGKGCFLESTPWPDHPALHRKNARSGSPQNLPWEAHGTPD